MTTIVLAAGQGRRLGGPKAMLAWPDPEGRQLPLAAAHAEQRLAAESGRVLVVVRSSVASALAPWLPAGASVLCSTAEERLGPAGSIAAAVLQAELAGPVVLTPVDTVPARASTVAALLAAVRPGGLHSAARPRHGGRGGHPVIVQASALARYRQSDPPPLRDHLRSLGSQVAQVSVDDPTVLLDLDTPVDWAAIAGAGPRFLGPAPACLAPRAGFEEP